MGGWQISWEQKCRGSCGQALPHSESTANLLMRNGANFDIFSECALILLANWSDFDSVMRRFDSSRPSQPIYLIVLEFFAWQFSDCFHSETAFRCPRNVCTYPNSDQI